MYSFCHNRNLPLAIEKTMVAIVHKMQVFCLSISKKKRHEHVFTFLISKLLHNYFPNTAQNIQCVTHRYVSLSFLAHWP